MNPINIFTDEECHYLNSLTEHQLKSSIKRDDILKMVQFAKTMSDNDDADISRLIDNVYGKINAMSDTEWKNIVKAMPFDMNISLNDVIDEADFNDNFKNTYKQGE